MNEIPFPKQSKQKYLVISALGILLGIFLSYRMRWLGDDIFIALRYVQNFIEGNGLVYNVGEHVEGYTDFLWLMLISLFSLLKFDPAASSEILGIIFSTGTLIIFSVIGYKTAILKNKFIFPFITLALVFNYDYHVWATSGLEVSFVTFLLSAAFYIYFFSNYAINKRLVISGSFLCFALMTRPDVMLILLFLNVLLFIKNLVLRQGIIQLIKTHFLFNLAVLLIYLPYFLWRYNYYGFIFPNTYYDKLGYENAFSQGFYYIWLYFKCHFTSFLFLLPLFLFFPLLLKQGAKKFILNKEYAALYTAFSTLFVYLIFFVAKVGGDFMFARFIIACVPFIYFIIFYSVVLTGFKYANTVLLLILALSTIETFVRINLFIKTDEKGNESVLFPEGIADERYCYLYYGNIEREEKRGKELNERLKDLDYKAIIFGAQARFAYYANFSYCQEYFGLTDTLIAHSEIKERGRIGHEKHGTIEYFESKQIHFSFNATPFKNESYRLAQIDLPSGQMNVEIITYDNLIIEKMAQKLGKDFRYVNFPQYLDAYITNTLPAITSFDQLNRDYQNFYAYYFKNNTDPKREILFTNRLNELKNQ